jgi:hypothetical protein
VPKPRITVYGLGAKGINLVKSPLHLDNDELVLGQNAEFFTEQGVAGIRMRSGFIAADATTLGDAQVNGGIGIPLPPPGDNGLSPIFVVKAQGSGYVASGSFTWDSSSTPDTAGAVLYDIVWAESLGLFVGVGGTLTGPAALVLTSPDGVTWTARTAADTSLWHGLAWSGSLLVAVASTGANQVMTSPDGTHGRRGPPPLSVDGKRSAGRLRSRSLSRSRPAAPVVA